MYTDGIRKIFTINRDSSCNLSKVIKCAEAANYKILSFSETIYIRTGYGDWIKTDLHVEDFKVRG